jgi:transposase
MSQYTNGTDTSYIVKFNSNKSVQVILSHDGDRELPDADNCTNYVGFDANSKHNQLTGSNGITVDYDRILLDDLFNELKNIDQLKAVNKDYKPSNRRIIKIDTLRRKMIHHTERNCSNICKTMVANGENHAVFEDLDNSFGRTYAKTSDGINYNRLVKEMHMSSIKDEFDHISRKHGIAVTTVHPEYTSQECSKCHCIDDANRQTQEKFVCVQCGHTDNADHNSSINIEGRVSNAVLRDKLLIRSKLGNGSYSPKSMKRYKVKEMLLSLRYNLSILGKRESTESTVW